MAGTVTIACKLPNGLKLRVFEMREVSEQPIGGPPRTIKQSYPRPETVTVQGFAAAAGVAKFLVGGYALTHNVDADFWAAWEAQNKEHPAVKAGLIFAHAKSDMTSGKAKEQREIRSGLEPLAQRNDPRAPKRPNASVSPIEPDVAA